MLNIILSTVLRNKSPYQLLYNKLASLSHMRFIGCLYFATCLTQKDKLCSRDVRAALVGYSSSQKGYKLYDLENRLFFVSRDVVFMESVFPFKGSIANQQSNLTSHGLFCYDELVS